MKRKCVRRNKFEDAVGLIKIVPSYVHDGTTTKVHDMLIALNLSLVTRGQLMANSSYRGGIYADVKRIAWEGSYSKNQCAVYWDQTEVGQDYERLQWFAQVSQVVITECIGKMQNPIF
jgi:hypothetical protein